MDQGQGLVIIAGLLIFQKDLCRGDRQGAVDIDREILKFRQQLVLLDLSQIIEHDLGPAHRKSRDHDVAAPGEGIPEDPGQFLDRVLLHIIVQPVPVGRLHDDIVGPGGIDRILEQGLVLVADIAGKDDLFLRPALRQPHLDAGRPQQMADVGKAETHPVAQGVDLIVGLGCDQVDQVHGVLHRIDGLHPLLVTGPLVLFISPLRLHGLDVGGIAEHDVAETGGRLRRHDLAPEAVLVELWQHTRMVDMGMRHHDKIYFGGVDRQRHILKLHAALPHTAVDQNIFGSHL